MTIGEEYLKTVLERFKGVKKLGDLTIDQLSEENLHWAYNKESNSVSMIVKHVSGNMVSRWTDFLTSDGEKENRDRDAEFIDDDLSKSELIELWELGWETLFETISDLTEPDLLKYITIRGEKHMVLEAIERQMAHYASHIGQIVYIGKQLRGTEWQNLSIPKGQSEAYLQEMLNKHRSEL